MRASLVLDLGRKSAMRALLALTFLAVAGAVFAQQTPATAPKGDPKAKATKTPAKKATVTGPRIELEPAALALIKAASDRLAGARTMSFTAVMSYESPSRLGPALVYSTRADVALQRPDKLRVLMPGDGPASEFYYDGKSMVAFAPKENLVAVTAAPATIDATLDAAFQTAHIYFPFADLIIADPYKEWLQDLRVAFVIGRSNAVGGVVTDMVALVGDYAFMQVWIGSDDKLPRRIRAVFRKDRLQLRHQMDLSNWRIDAPVTADAFTASAAAKAALPIAFARPEPATMAPGARAPLRSKPAPTK